MAYPPNRDAAHWLANDIAPLLRARRPEVRLCVIGRRASALGLGTGVEVISDVPDLGAYLRRARVALVPLRDGTGSPSKVIEAAASGAALVCTAWPAQRYGLPARTAETAAEFAQAALELLEDESARRQAVEAAWPAVRACRFESLAAELDAILRASLHDD
jgi:glycosyltransferase involved in cell wall biosynthesis